jgi:hypothetical protein
MKRILTSIVVIAAAAALAVTALAAPAAKQAQARRVHKLTIVMHDPGCHWFAVRHGFKKSVSVRGIAVVKNIDEAALIFKTPTGHRAKLPVGKSFTIKKPGLYHITMFHQAPDDNHLLLRIRR